MSTLHIHTILFTTRTYLTFALSLINADGGNAAVDPLRVELFTRPFLPFPFLTPPTRKGLGTKLITPRPLHHTHPTTPITPHPSHISHITYYAHVYTQGRRGTWKKRKMKAGEQGTGALQITWTKPSSPTDSIVTTFTPTLTPPLIPPPLCHSLHRP